MAYILAENPFAKLCNLRFESIVISDVGKTLMMYQRMLQAFESIVISDVGKTIMLAFKKLL